jgi:Ion channel
MNRIQKLAKLGFAPTRVLFECLKVRRTREKRRELLEFWTCFFFALSAVGVVLIYLAQSLKPNLDSLFPHWIRYFLWFAVWVWPFSRINEIFIAFYNDAPDRLTTADEESETGIPTSQRLNYLLRSYAEVTLNFGFVYLFTDAFMPHGMFTRCFKDIAEAVYFSATTITTLGYDIFPRRPWSWFLCVYELVVGLTLVVITIASYFARIFESQRSKK